MPLLRLIALSKSYEPPFKAVDEVSIDIEAGEIICLLGPSGCGKTTLLRLVAGLEQLDQGEIWFSGRDLAGLPPYRRDFGLMFQDYALFPHKNVYENVAFGLRMQGVAKPKLARRVADMLELVDLSDFAARDIALLSGGEQQRVALARALAPDPALLMLDEPLGALDRALRERLMLELRAILKRVDLTAIYVTHDQAEAFAIADRVVVMNRGRIEQIGTPESLYGRPLTRFVAGFLGFQNLLPGTVMAMSASETTLVDTVIGPLPLAAETPGAGSQVTVLIRPDAALLVDPNGAADRSEALSLPAMAATVSAVAFRGRYYQVWLRPRAWPDDAAGLQFDFPASVPWRVGQEVSLRLDPSRFLLLPT